MDIKREVYNLPFGNYRVKGVSTNGLDTLYSYSILNQDGTPPQEDFTIPIVNQSDSHNLNDISYSNLRLEYPISNFNGTLMIGNPTKISYTGDLRIDDVFIEDDNLIVLVSQLEEGKNYSVTILNGIVLNSGIPNNNSITTLFKTKEPDATIPIILRPDLDGKNNVPISTSEVRFKIDSEYGDLSVVDESLIVSTAGLIIENITIIGDELIINFSNLEYETDYSIIIYSGAIANSDKLNEERISIYFSTEQEIIAENPDENILWSLEFTLGDNQRIIKLKDIPNYDEDFHKFTIEEFYGVLDSDIYWENIGVEVSVEIIYLGLGMDGFSRFDPHPVDTGANIPGARYEWEPQHSYDGYVIFDPIDKELRFTNGSLGNGKYLLVRRIETVNRTVAPY